MAQILVRNVDERVKVRIQRRARRNGRSMEGEVREILREAAREKDEPVYGLGTEIANMFRGIGLKEGEEIQELRGFPVKPISFDE